MSVEGSGLILLSSCAVLVLLTENVVGVLMLIWSIMMVECIYKVPANNGFNH